MAVGNLVAVRCGHCGARGRHAKSCRRRRPRNAPGLPLDNLRRFWRRSDGSDVVYRAGGIVGYRHRGHCWLAWRQERWRRATQAETEAFETAPYRGEVEA